MKKSMFASFTLLAVCTILSFFVLLCYLQECWQTIMQETIYAIFTGCIFAIPSTIIVLITDSTKNGNREYKIAYDLEATVKQLNKQIDKNEISGKIAGQYIERLMAFHIQLNEIAINYLFLDKCHREYLNEAQRATFDLIKMMREVNDNPVPGSEEPLTKNIGSQANKEKVQNYLTAVQNYRKFLRVGKG